jgi:hypothetical protein
MKLQRCLTLTGVPVLAGLALTGPALAATAPPVSVRIVGGPTRTLLSRTVNTPLKGSVTKGGTPKGACPEDSAAGALSVATSGRFNGTYYNGLGIDVTSILGRVHNYDNGAYWGFYVNDHFASKGICATKLVAGKSLLFAPVPDSGNAPLPIVVRAPATVSAGTPFKVRTFVYPGKSSKESPVTSPSFSFKEGGATEASTNAKGITKLTASTPGTLEFVVTAAGEIRSERISVTVTGS